MFLGSALLLTAQLCWSWPDLTFSCISAMAYSNENKQPSRSKRSAGSGRARRKLRRAGGVAGRDGSFKRQRRVKLNRTDGRPLQTRAANVLVACSDWRERWLAETGYCLGCVRKYERSSNSLPLPQGARRMGVAFEILCGWGPRGGLGAPEGRLALPVPGASRHHAASSLADSHIL